MATIKPEDKSAQPHTLDDASEAFGHYRASKGKYDGHKSAASAARSAMESHEREAAKEKEILDRYASDLRKILGNLEKF